MIARTDENPVAEELKNYQSARPFAFVVTGLFLLLGAAVGASIVSAAMENSLLAEIQAARATVEEAIQSDQRQSAVAILYQLAFLVTGGGYLFWVHRLSLNLWSLRLSNDRPLRFSPGWAVGWWFIPVMSLWRPYLVMREIWTRSHPSGVGSYLMLLWWALWVVGSIWSYWRFFYSRVGSIDSLHEAYVQNIQFVVLNGVILAAAALAVILVWQITVAQDRKFKDLMRTTASE